jgi:serine/threonine protein kinase
MSASDCPPDDRLRAYELGDVTEAEIEAIADHLRGCPGCVARLSGLQAGTDPILAVLRADLGKLPDASAYWRVVDELTDRPADAPARKRLGAGDRLGEYRLLEELGEGGMGTVYRAVHARLERVVAVKVLRRGRWADPASLARFEREMKAVGRLRHPNIVHATDAGEADSVPYLVMELVDGRNLARVVKEDGPLPLTEACEAVRQAAVGLQHAHEAGLVHRDVKPSNLIRTAEGTVKLLDLGLAMMTSSPPDPELGAPSSPTRAGESLTSRTVGTLEYMAPEQRRDPHQVDARADVYGLGCTLWFLLTGKPPRAGEAVGSGPDPGGLPAELWRRFLASDPADRFPTAAAAAAALNSASRPDRGRRLTRRAWLAITGGSAAAALAAAVVFRPRPESAKTIGSTATGRGTDSGAGRRQLPRPPIGKAPLTPAEAKDLQKRWADYLGRPVTYDGPHGMRFVLIPPGEVGLRENPTPRDEKPPDVAAQVTITSAYYLGTCEVTIAQFRAFIDAAKYVTEPEENGMGGTLMTWTPHPSGDRTRPPSRVVEMKPEYVWRNPGYPGASEQHPVTQVSWRDATRFCEWLGHHQGTYRLPSEAEWVWATLAGSPGFTFARPDGGPITDYLWYALNSDYRPQPVATRKPNPWGLFDTTGNVGEWCLDWYDKLPTGTFTDWRGPADANPKGLHVYCGTVCHSNHGGVTRSRLNSADYAVGFRVLRDANTATD